ncbi:hypothetical protein [Photobacterium aquimaris]|uniref:Uncharacterized protein n=1 Tax=Photobacterium aquimaris TaxID=512643 RepID=A0A2T3HWF6_9GAMM|nr:hypothetical protein [Photobacterium aquimaris]OBU22236.1 hypothetical protein AYY21_03150 [Photobacterium aquimaris]PQJ38284.1 hypothetical protein BTN98_12615 [Photobacterium aquimaris]PSU03221.1 hypothetical protein C0W81_12475 [Photobacterium aquimaris]
MTQVLLNQRFIEEIQAATRETLTIELGKDEVSDDIGRFAAKQLYLGDIKKLVDEDYIFSMYHIKNQVLFLGQLLKSREKYDTLIDKDSIEIANEMIFKTNVYVTICALLFAMKKKEEGEDPCNNDYFNQINPNCDDINLINSRDKTKPSKVLSDEEFNEFGDDYPAIFKWVNDPSRRFTQVPPVGQYPVTNIDIIYDFSDLAGIKGLIMPELESKLIVRSQALSKSFKKIIGDKGSLERYCHDRTSILGLSLELRFDYKAFLPWLEKAINEQHRNTIKVLSALISGSMSEDKRMYSEDILMKFSDEVFNIIPHPEHKPTNKLTPFLCTNIDIVIAVEKTKFASIFIPRYCGDSDLIDVLPNDIYKYYALVTPETTPYGRNSNLRQIPELAWCDLLKVKVRTQHDFNKIMELIGIYNE